MNSKSRKVYAISQVHGGRDYPSIHGTVKFKQMHCGVLVTAEIRGLPCNDQGKYGVFAFHIHDGGSCTGNEDDEFANVGSHFNPSRAKHPYHAGDLPPLFSNNGYAFMSVFTSRFIIRDIIGHTIIIHSRPDDFTSQPSGNPGSKIACGKICG